jgi:hypothetical protein
MRITREHLTKIAVETAAQRCRADRTIVSAFLAGSVLSDEPLLGGTTDIDLFLIHDSEPLSPREIVRVSPEVHLDIIHHSQTLYHHPRRLRMDARIGYILISNPMLLHDTQHWFEFIQASVRSQFWQPDNVIQRVRPMLEQARQLWVGLPALVEEGSPFIGSYLDALEAAANAVSCLNRGPLPVRRFLIQFPQRAEAIGHARLGVGLPALVGHGLAEAGTARGWLPAWKAAVQAAGSGPDAPVEIHPHRLVYYERAIDALLESGPAGSGLWPLLRTWTMAVDNFAENAIGDVQAYQNTLQQLHLDADHMPDRLNGLDAYLDSVEEALEEWAAANGVE